MAYANGNLARLASISMNQANSSKMISTAKHIGLITRVAGLFNTFPYARLISLRLQMRTLMALWMTVIPTEIIL